MLTRAISAPLGDYCLETKSSFLKKSLRKSLYYFVKNCQKKFIFKVLKVHLQVLLLLKNSGYMDITLLLKVQVLMK